MRIVTKNSFLFFTLFIGFLIDAAICDVLILCYVVLHINMNMKQEFQEVENVCLHFSYVINRTGHVIPLCDQLERL